MTCGSGNTLPSAVFGASAHPPQAPIWLDPSGCPPGRVFILWIALHFPGVLLHLLFDDVRNPAVPACRLDREDIEAPEQYGSSVLLRGHSLDFVKVFHKIILSCLGDSRPLRPASVFLLTGWFMTHRIDVTCGHLLAARWQALAEQRLEHLTELFESGRWRRYYSERAFLDNIQEAKAAVGTWRSLARGPAEIDRTIEIPQPSRMRAPSAAGTEFVSSDEAPSAPLVDLRALEQALNEPGKPAFDIAAIEQRYPALRHAL